MIKKITKRDGRVVNFDATKILNAITKAVDRSEEDVKVGELVDEVVSTLNSKYKGSDIPTVEEIQDIIENVLIAHNYAKTAKEYITYRRERTNVREAKSRLMSTLKNITFQEAKDSDVKRENANIDGDTAMGTMLKYGSESAKDFYITHLLSKDVAAAHLNGDIHIHDLDFYTLTLTCCQIDLLKLFHGGFSTGHGFLREPNDIRSYAALACIAIQANQNDMHGGQAVPNFDFAMAEGVRKTYQKIFRNNVIKFIEFVDGKDLTKELKDYFKELCKLGLEPRYHDYKSSDKCFELLEKKFKGLSFSKIKKVVVADSEKEIEEQTHQAMEALIHNLNTMHSRAGAQVPFSSLNYGTDTSEEGRLAVRSILKATIEGLGDGETPIFPIQIFKVKEGVSFNPEDPNYDLFKLAIECSAKRLFPNFSFLDAPFNKQYYKEGDYNSEVAYMGCRTRVMGNNFDPSKEVTCGRGNLSFTSINLPRLGIEAHKDIDLFFKKLDDMIDLVIKQLLERFEVQRHKKVKNMPFLMGQKVWLDSEKLSWDDEIDKVIRHGTLTVGFIGLAECLVALTSKHHGESEESQALGLKIVSRMREKMDKASKKYNLNFSLIATPAEGLSGRFVKIDKKKYGVIKGITDREYYTNSFHVPVYYPISMFKKIDLEAPYHALTNGGHITYIEADGDLAKNTEAFEKIVRHMKDAGIGYGAVNHPVDRDPVCGYNGIIDNECPKCGRKEEEGEMPFERIRRITGYLVGTLDRFNNGKRAEEHDRVKHKMGYSSGQEGKN
ncbi:MAG TPA: anaerobic ribonucleoside triphosphate reductase [Firmicutes bacterium]|nr:anaerobic ribonucleoside triphosphate reductase [Bacillota bacterium]